MCSSQRSRRGVREPLRLHALCGFRHVPAATHYPICRDRLQERRILHRIASTSLSREDESRENQEEKANIPSAGA